MKLLFSECKPDYGHYIFPYAVWGFPEPGETPAMLFEQGFLPSSRNLDRFYLCRQIRIRLRQFKLSSENRRILRKGHGIAAELLPRDRFDYTPQWREFCRTYADIRFGKDVMSAERLDSLFRAPVTSHVLVFTDTNSGKEVGTVTLYLEPPSMAYYYYAFYDLNYYRRNLGMYMMTFAAQFFAGERFEYLYLGTCYQPTALYKTQFTGAQFFNGVRWSDDLAELKYLLQRDQSEHGEHLLEWEDYRRRYYGVDAPALAKFSGFRVLGPKK